MSLVGRLEDLALPDIFQIISLSKKTGTLTVRSGQATGVIMFKSGQVVQAASDGIRDSLGNILVSQGMVSESVLTQALALQKEEADKPLGMILVDMNAVTQQTVEGVVRKQIEEIVFDLLAWQEGSFSFELGEIVAREQFLLMPGISAEYLLMEGTRILDEKRQGIYEPSPSPPSAPPPAPKAPQTSRPGSEPARAEFRDRIEKEEPRQELAALKSMFAELRFPTATAEVTLLILRYASEVVNRAILFMVKKDEVRGLGQFGIELAGKSADQVVRTITVPLNKPSLFLTVIASRRSFHGMPELNECNRRLMNELGGVIPDSVLAIPLIVDGKVALIVYGDNLPERKPMRGVDTLEIFMNQAGMALEKALLEKRLAELQKENR